MSLINQDIKNFVQGISQQPDTLRNPEQLDAQLNGYSSEANGLLKRPPSVFEANLGKKESMGNKPLIHFVERDASEKYVMIFTGTGVEVYDLQGNQKTVKYEGNSKPYLYTQSPRRTLKPVTIADYTFITNISQQVGMSNKKGVNKWANQGLLVNIKSGQYGRTYRIDVNGATIASYETPDGSDKSHTKKIATDNIVNELATKCAEQGYTVEKGSSWLYINKSNKVTESGEDVTLRPSTTPKQQYDRFMGLRNTLQIWVAKYTSKVSLDPFNKKIIIEGGIKTDMNGNSSFSGTGQAMMDEINRCRNDRWSIQEEDIQIVFDGGKLTSEGKRYTLTYTETAKPNTETYDKTDIKTFAVYDGFNNQAAFGIMRSVQKFTNLPATAPEGYVVKVSGEDGSESDDYYVEFDDTDKVWKECVRPDLENEFDTNTMPHVLVREADGTFTFKTAEWNSREIGDNDSNPIPSFIGETINDIFYYRNRLGFLSGENVVLSRSADFFNFWMASAIEVQDTDPIDLAVSDTKIATLYHAVPFDAELIIFSKDAQFALRTDGVLSPKDALLTPPVTHYGCSLKAAPVNAGRNIYFTAERSEYTTVREFFTAADNTDSKDAQDITSHVPNYIPNGVYKIIPSNTENVVLYLTEGEEESMYVYKYLFIDSVRQQASWSKWTFGDKIYGGAFIDNYLYIIIERNGYFCLEKMSFTFNTEDFIDREPYRVLLDSKRVYNVPKTLSDLVREETIIDLKKVFGDLYDKQKTYSVVMSDGTYAVANGDGVVVLQGDYEGKDLVCGINYNFFIRVSKLYVKQETQSGMKALLEGRLQLRNFWFNYADSGYFKVTVRTSDKENYEYVNTQRFMGTTSARLDTMPFSSGKFRVPVYSLNTNCDIELESDTPTQVSLIGAGWVGNYVRRTRLY